MSGRQTVASIDSAYMVIETTEAGTVIVSYEISGAKVCRDDYMAYVETEKAWYAQQLQETIARHFLQ
jgi:hypothetical protein